MTVVFHKRFDRAFERLPKSLQQKTKDAIRRFVEGPFHPLLRNHALKGRLFGRRAFYVSNDIRVVFREQDGYAVVLMLDVGSHDRVYR